MKIRTLLVDDEPLARQRLRTLLAPDPDIDIVGECGDGSHALASIHEFKPDLMWLDVQMPVLDGFGVLQELDPTDMPVVVFVTAYDRFALKAFEVNALDYLLKPYDKERFAAALGRAKAQFRQRPSASMEKHLLALMNAIQERRPTAERLVVKSAGRVTFVRIDEIDWIEAAGNYVHVHAGKENHLLRESMSSLEAKLDPRRFVRIHRSTIVNIERIREMQAAFHGDQMVKLRDGVELTLSRGYREKLERVLGNVL